MILFAHQLFLLLLSIVCSLQAVSAGPNAVAVKPTGDVHKGLLASYFCSHMVLQRSRPIPLWGFARPDNCVTVSAFGRRFCTHAGAGGRWRVELPGQKTSTKPVQISVQCGQEEIHLDDVLVGDVFLCAGQSNMLMAMADTQDCSAHDLTAQIPVRIINIGIGPEEMAVWTDSHAKTIEQFSAVATICGDRLAAATEVPIGLVQCAIGGTSIADWIATDQLPAALAKKIIGQVDIPVYDKYLRPVLPLPVSGILWYQGESDFEHAGPYEELFAIFVNCLRHKLGANTPVFLVQLPAFGPAEPYYYDSLMARFREAQSNCQKVSNCYYIPSLDVVPKTVAPDRSGWIAPVHLHYKRIIGERLADMVLCKCYGLAFAETPEIQQVVVLKNCVEVSISGCGKGLCCLSKHIGDPLVGFTIAGVDRRFHIARARILGSDVIISSNDVLEPVAVRYQWADNGNGNLYAKNGMPVPPFRTDTWPLTKPYARYGYHQRKK